jgi:hypothetical protein
LEIGRPGFDPSLARRVQGVGARLLDQAVDRAAQFLGSLDRVVVALPDDRYVLSNHRLASVLRAVVAARCQREAEGE